MKTRVIHNGTEYAFDLARPINLAIRLQHGESNPNAFYAPQPEFSPVVSGDFIGSTVQGGPLNFFNVAFNPHGNGTHTECVGHIARERYAISDQLSCYFFFAQVISIEPRKLVNGDRVITRHHIEDRISDQGPRALIIRTIPNDDSKMSMIYSGSNPTYCDPAFIDYIVNHGIDHLVIDLPSVDREEDEGKLLSHRAFWRYPDNIREHATITELAFIPDSVPDGLYFLNLMVANFDLDVSPSKPCIYELQ